MKRHGKTDSSKQTKGAKRSKLQLRRETLRVLSSEDLSEVAGGALYYYYGGGGDGDTGFSGGHSCDLTHCK